MEQRSDRFHVQINVGDDVVEMRASGEVDIATVSVLRAALWAAPARPLLRLDVSGVRLLSAAGVRALVAAHRRVRARGGELVLVDPTPTVARVLHVTGLSRVIPVRACAAAGPLAAAPVALEPAASVTAASAGAAPALLALPPGLLAPLVTERGTAPLVPA
uniref:Anti-sigma factor antagonist n=1 Tax=Micromonospora carbonacea TaxID=47853 RepID=A0A7D5YCB2_9ACTN|nr:STAS domain-containing protein [Micromonospora sp. ATCC 39149]QLJ96455.1 STAS domain-containing protein [Micromonospora carbonacea]